MFVSIHSEQKANVNHMRVYVTCKKNNYYKAEMSGTYNKIYMFSQEQIYMKIPFAIYADTQSLLEKGKHVITFTSFQQNYSHQN